ncbi:MAG TPA: ABC transporter ATP-binding protein/permease [Steroidobacteraceae bacterium]|nr:ABC transporter ATP-binding protein/permease [Steroidobacteraceae bacterium]
MTDRSAKAVPDASSVDEAAHAGLVFQLRGMWRALWSSPVRNTLLMLGAAVFIVIVATAYGQIRLNRWNRPFYDALAHREFGEFAAQLGVFALIAGVLLVLNVAQKWIGEMLKVKLREGLAHDLIENWMQPRRAFRVAHAGPIGINPDQRMHEDTRHLTELSSDLGIGLAQASVLLAAFVGVLWNISSSFDAHIAGHTIPLSGYMVWAAVIYAASASLLTYWAGRSLVARNAERYAREADLRFSLVRVNEHIDAITLGGGEADAARRLELDLARVLVAMRAIVTGLTELTWVTAGYGWFTLVAPIIAAAPLYFSGQLSFGGLMMAAGAFNQVQSSLRWFVDNFSTIADWRATLLRVAMFRRAVITTDELHGVEGRIAIVDGAPGKMQLEHLEISSEAGCTRLDEKRLEVSAGERVLIMGDHGAGKTLFFRALAGLWPWGSGRIVRPRGESILYVPRTPYVSPGTLREVLAYPGDVKSFKAAAFARALTRVGLDRLVPMLDQSGRWDQSLSADEQEALTFARIVLHAPAWVIFDDVLGSLDGDTLKRALDVLAHDLEHSAIIHVGSTRTHDDFFSRVAHLTKDTAARKLARERARTFRPAWQTG